MSTKTLNVVGIVAISIGALLLCIAVYAFVITLLRSKSNTVEYIAKKEELIPPRPDVYENLLTTNQLIRQSN